MTCLQALAGPTSPTYSCFNADASEIMILGEKPFVPEQRRMSIDGDEQRCVSIARHSMSPKV